MPISSACLKIELQKFIDAESGVHEGFPSSAADFKTKFAAAVDKYLEGVAAIEPTTVAPPSGNISVVGCGAAFASEFTMAKVYGVFPTDMAAGWTKMVEACVLTPGGVYAPTRTITVVNPFSYYAPAMTVAEDMNTLMLTSNTGNYACEIIASAIHSATLLAFVTTCTYVIPGSPPTPTQGPIAFG